MTGRRTDGLRASPEGPAGGGMEPPPLDCAPTISHPLDYHQRSNGHSLPAANGHPLQAKPGPARAGEKFEVAKQVYAALDLGTNNCRLLVARPSRRGFLVIDAFSKIIRLGEGLSHSGVLSEEAMARTIDALKICSAKMNRRGVTRSRLIATEACRIARNGPAFIARVKRETGLSLEIIGQETEARLAVSGCASLIDKSCDFALVFDIGGGSSELVWLNLNKGQRTKRVSLQDRIRVQDAIEAWTSLRLGVVTLADRFDCRELDEARFDEVVRYVMSQFEAFESQHQIARRLTEGKAHFLGTSGTVTTIAGVHLGLRTYTRAKVDGCWLRAADIRMVSRKIMEMTYQQRKSEPCIGPERADLVLAGCAILEAMLRAWPCERLRVADRGLREGILTTLISEDLSREKRLRSATKPAPSRFVSSASTV